MMVTPWMDIGDASTYVKDIEVDPRPLVSRGELIPSLGLTCRFSCEELRMG